MRALSLISLFGIRLVGGLVYNCSAIQQYARPWIFHCFDGVSCLTSDIQICQTHLPAKCPDGSDQSDHFCQRVGVDQFYCCNDVGVDLPRVCDGTCDCTSCDDEYVCRGELPCDYSIQGMSIGIIIAISLSVFFLFVLMVVCAVCFFCFKCLDVVRGWQSTEPKRGSGAVGSGNQSAALDRPVFASAENEIGLTIEKDADKN